jgi:hypothetical protein
MTNNLHLLLPEPGWHQALRDVTRQQGTLLALDETHTHVVGPGGATGLWHLHPDIVTIGKAVAGGLPMGVYGVTSELAEHPDAARNLATGGTLFGNPLSAAAGKAALTQVLVPAAYARTAALGRQLADGTEDAINMNGLPWTAIRFGPRSGQWYGPMPRTGAQAHTHTLTDDKLTRLIRIWLANRGIWDGSAVMRLTQPAGWRCLGPLAPAVRKRMDFSAFGAQDCGERGVGGGERGVDGEGSRRGDAIGQAHGGAFAMIAARADAASLHAEFMRDGLHG